MNKNKGFTLIELLVVIAIIGILAVTVLGALNSARVSARDSRRQSDIRNVTSAIEMYKNDNNGNAPATLNALVPTYIASVPTDPNTADNGGVAYAYDIGSGVNVTSYAFCAKLSKGTSPFFCSVNGSTGNYATVQTIP